MIDILYWKHYPVPELRRRPAALICLGKPHITDQIIGKPFLMQVCQQLLPPRGCISQPKVFARLIREPTLVQIFLCLDTPLVSKQHIIKFCRFFVDFQKPLPPALTPLYLL